jgi:hypothetical protein
MKKNTSAKNELLSLMNLGPATQKDLALLGITTKAQLAKASPDELYKRLQKITGKKHDPCVWDTFAAIIHEANTGEKIPWWHWTPRRKARMQ